MSPQDWRELTEAWAAQTGRADSFAVYQRPQQSRPGFAVLILNRGRPLAFVRVRQGGAGSFHAEQRVLRLLEATDLPFWHPAVLGLAASGEWHSLLTTTLPPVPHRPAFDADINQVALAITAALAPGLPRPEGVPDHWEPMHGDLTPWNLRRVRDAVALVDWEDAGWGPPHADATLFNATTAALGAAKPIHAPHEAVGFWLHRGQAREPGAVDDAFASRLQAVLKASLVPGPAD